MELRLCLKGLAATYSRGIYKTTTIGKAAFDGRVRNGNGSGHSFMTTKVRADGPLPRCAARGAGLAARSHLPALNLRKSMFPEARPLTGRGIDGHSSLKTTHRLWASLFGLVYNSRVKIALFLLATPVKGRRFIGR